VEKKNIQNNPKTHTHQLFLEIKNEKIRSNGKTNNRRAEEGYCYETIKADHPLTVKATKGRIYPEIQRLKAEWFEQGRK
jgi:hypothetical protein